MIRISGWKSTLSAFGVLCCLAVFLSATAQSPQSAAPGQLSITLDPSQSTVHWILDTTLHTVHGTFHLKSGALQVSTPSGKAEGQIVVLAASGDSGNSSRDERMRQEILETLKFPEIIFHPTEIAGPVAPSGSSDVTVKGQLLLHGSSHDVSVPVHIERNGHQWKATGKFDVPFVAWGIKDPSTWLLKTQKTVNIELHLAGNVNP